MFGLKFAHVAHVATLNFKCMVIFPSLFFSAILSKIFSTVKQGKEHIFPRISGGFTSATFLNAAGKAKDMLI